MSIFDLEKHNSCSEYQTELRLGFKSVEMDGGTLFGVTDKKEKHLFFILEGRVKVSYNEYPNREFGAGEMFFLPKSADCRGEVLTKCRIMVHVYDAPVRLCDKLGFNEVLNNKQYVQHEFKSLPICQTLSSYLLLLKTYLDDGINCCHLHEIKQKELFLIFHAHYSKEELAQLFYPVIGKSLDFRNVVMEHYTDAKTAKQLAGYCGYSEVYFHNLFIAEFGDTPYRWMQKQKANHIIGRLGQKNVSIEEIVDEFDFSSRCHLNKYCKRQYGDTAAKIRANLLSVNQ